MSFKIFSALALTTFTLAACSSSTTGGTGGTSSSSGGAADTTKVSSADCSSRCTTKVKGCPSLASTVDTGCAQVCGSSLTESQLTCLEGKSCDDIEKAETFNALCPAPASSSSSSGGTPPTGNFKKNGEACTCPDASSGFNQCSGTSGPCDSDLVCFGVDKDTVCGTSCKNGEACATGFTCTTEIYQGITIGKFCKKS